MENFNTLSVDGKEVAFATLNGRVVYSQYKDLGSTSIISAAAGISLQQPDDGSYVCPNGVTYEYKDYTLLDAMGPVTLGTGTGNTNPFAVSPHIATYAHHYATTPSTISYYDDGSGDVVLSVLERVNLSTWAKSTGKWTDSYIDSLAIGDIDLLKFDKSVSIADYFIPWYMSYQQFQALFQRDSFDNLVAWCNSKNANMGPVIFKGTNNGELQWTTPNLLSAALSSEFEGTKFAEIGPTYLGTTGDSGRPVGFYIRNESDTYEVVVSHNHQVVVPVFGPVPPYYMSGPNYLKAFDLLREFVKEYEGSDAIKQLPMSEFK